MSKRVKILVSVLAATLLILVVGTMVVLADDGPAPGVRAGMNDFIDRVAAKLGIEPADLQTAFEEVKNEMRAENPDGWFGRAPRIAPMAGVAESLGVELQALQDAFT